MNDIGNISGLSILTDLVSNTSPSISNRRRGEKWRISPEEMAALDAELLKRTDNPDFAATVRAVKKDHGFIIARSTAGLRAKSLGLKSNQDFYKLKFDAIKEDIVPNSNLSAVARKHGVDPVALRDWAWTQLGIRGKGRRQRTKWNKLVEALSAPDNPYERLSNPVVAEKLGASLEWVAEVRRVIGKSHGLPYTTMDERRVIITNLQQGFRLRAVIENLHHSSNLVGRIAWETGIPTDKRPKPIDVTLFLDAAEELVRQHFDGRDKKRSLPTASGWLSNIESIRQPAISPVLNATLSHYLECAGIKDADELQSKTNHGPIPVKLPPKIFYALHFTLAAEGTIFDRLRVKCFSNKKPDPAPNRKFLEKIALAPGAIFQM